MPSPSYWISSGRPRSTGGTSGAGRDRWNRYHLDLHVAAALDPVGRLLGSEPFATTPVGYQLMLSGREGFGLGTRPERHTNARETGKGGARAGTNGPIRFVDSA